MTVPVWVWAVSAAALIAVVAAEVALTGRSGALTPRRALGWVAVYVSLTAAFGLAVGVTAGWGHGRPVLHRLSDRVQPEPGQPVRLLRDHFLIRGAATLVVACNAFALMGLRQLYALLAGMLGRLAYLNRGLAVVCAFIGVRLLLRALPGSGVRVPTIPAWPSVLVVAAVLVVTVVLGAIDDRRPLGAAGRAMLEWRFAVIDTDGNGVWQREDCQLLTRRLCETLGYAADSAAGHALASAQRVLFDAMLSHMDANRDDEISREEFVVGMRRGRPVDGPGFEAAVSAAARSLIQVADTDRNEVFDPGEYARLAAVYGAGAGEAGRTFDRLDRDRNGVLGATELTLAIRQFFASGDPGVLGSVAFGRL